MSSSEVLDEILALKSIFCNPGEFHFINPSCLEALEASRGPISFKIGVKCTVDQRSNDATKSPDKTPLSSVVEITIVLPPDYPQTSPEISLSCADISKKGLSSLRNKLKQYTENIHTSTCEPVIMNMAMWLQENAPLFFDKPELANTLNCSSSGGSILLLKLDHMRNKTRYIKTITRWIDELNLNGRLFFANHLIFILLTGGTGNVREYLRRQKTCNVDVDSFRRPCKEKMINVLLQEVPIELR